ncbi:lycopene cyclase family protein [Streptomyces incarnatus]|nr:MULTISPECIES: lycopene cyclase family protein [Streptomyces]
MSPVTGHHDVLVLGGGVAGCVLAARLSEDPTRTVCLVEAGPDHGAVPADWPRSLRDAHALPYGRPARGRRRRGPGARRARPARRRRLRAPLRFVPAANTQLPVLAAAELLADALKEKAS